MIGHQIKENTICPNCNSFANGHDQIQHLFGLRDMGDGTIRVQSWCKKCRNASRKEVSV